MRLAVQYVLAKCLLMTPWSEPARFAILPLVVKQGLAVTTAGRGEINAAFESLASITQVFMPAVWVFLFRLCCKTALQSPALSRLPSVQQFSCRLSLPAFTRLSSCAKA